MVRDGLGKRVRLGSIVALGALLLLSADRSPAQVEPEPDAATVTGDSRQADRGSGAFPEDGRHVQLVVATTADSGAGSLRQVLREARRASGPVRVTFDADVFADPQTIRLRSPLPALTGEIIIDGFIIDQLWKPTGVTISGSGRHRVLEVEPGGQVELQNLMIASGRATSGGGVLNRGRLLVYGATFFDNVAKSKGGAVANRGGTLSLINSTFSSNRADGAGGGLANLAGTVTVTNCSFSDNGSRKGGAIYSRGDLLVRNTILANSEGGHDCVASSLLPGSRNNLIESNVGCGKPILTRDPRLEAFDYFNGPTKTLALRGDSPAINLGDNDSALDTDGSPLKWDQRGNGDPRFVAGYTDIGAFEYQRHAYLTVDTLDEGVLRACTRSGEADCPLRSAIELANASDYSNTITFDPALFVEPTTLVVSAPLPRITRDLVLEAGEAAEITIEWREASHTLEVAEGVDLQLDGVRVEVSTVRASQPAQRSRN